MMTSCALKKKRVQESRVSLRSSTPLLPSKAKFDRQRSPLQRPIADSGSSEQQRHKIRKATHNLYPTQSIMSKGQIDKLKVDRPPPLKDEPTSRRALWFLRHARVWAPAGAWPIVRSGLFNPTPLAEASMTS